MTYCVGVRLDRGLVFMSDTRTNAGLDNVSTFRKTHSWEVPGERVITLMTAGNLATTQAVVSMLEERTKAPADREPTILTAPSMFEVANIVAATLREVISTQTDCGQQADNTFNGTLILGGQIADSLTRLFLIYPEGNFIEAGEETPFFQIGETKYGRPILVRAYDRQMSFEAAVKVMLLSFDSTIKANLSVGPPIDLQIYSEGELVLGPSRRFDADDPYFTEISECWGSALKQAVDSLPDFKLDE
ncbi:MAG: peptidase [Pseudomonadota bacterium]